MLTTNKMPETKQKDERSCVPKVNMVASLLLSDMIDNNTEYQNVLSAGFLQSQHCCLNVDHNIKNHIILIILCVCMCLSVHVYTFSRCCCCLLRHDTLLTLLQST